MQRNTVEAYRSFNGDTEIPVRKLGPFVDCKFFFKFSEQERLDISKTYWSLGDNKCPNNSGFKCVNGTSRKPIKSLKLCATYKNIYFDSLPISKRE